MAGRLDEAEALYGDLMATRLTDTGHVDVNVLPNYAMFLIMTRQPAKALELLNKSTPSLDEVEAPQALGFYVALKACALADLGRDAEARRAFSEMKGRYAANHMAMNYAIACVASRAEQVAYLVRLMEDNEVDSLLLDLASARTAIGRSTEPISPFARMVRSLADDPVIRQASDRLGRALPASYEAALDEWREPS